MLNEKCVSRTSIASLFGRNAREETSRVGIGGLTGEDDLEFGACSGHVLSLDVGLGES